MMKNNPLDDIIKCNIDISNPASKSVVFRNILIVVPGPEGSGKESIGKTVAISSADKLLDYGYVKGDAAYTAASVAFAQNPQPDKLYVCVRRSVNTAGGAGETGEEESAEAAGKAAGKAAGTVYEDLDTTLKRACGEADFYGFHITDFRDPADVQAAVLWAEVNEKLFGFEYSDYANCPVSDFSYFRSYGIYSGSADGYGEDNQPAGNSYAALALMAKCFGYDPGSETWHMKELALVVPSALDDTQKRTLAEMHINTFARYAGCNIVIGGYTLSGEWIDVIRFRDWLKLEMQTNIFKAMKANRKIPFTDRGICLIEGKMEETLKKGQDVGGIAETGYDEEDNEVPGFTVTVPKVSDFTEAERKSRKATGFRYTARLSGAIHLVEIEGYLAF